MKWLPYSPDFNTIENLWTLMKAEIYRAYPELIDVLDIIATVLRLVQAD